MAIIKILIAPSNTNKETVDSTMTILVKLLFHLLYKLFDFHINRFNFSSPGTFQKDLDCVSQGILVLSNTGRNLNRIVDKQTP